MTTETAIESVVPRVRRNVLLKNVPADDLADFDEVARESGRSRNGMLRSLIRATAEARRAQRGRVGERERRATVA